MRSRIFAKVLAGARSLTTFTQNFFTSPHQSWLDTNGEPLAGGMLYVYEAGTSIPTDTWQDAALTQKNTNPVILDAGGFTSVWLDPTKVYKFRMCNSLGVQQWTIDDYQGGSLTANIVVPINFLLGATGSNVIDNGSFDQNWNWQLTGTNGVAGLAIAENAPSTNTNPNSVLVAIATLTGSTVPPFGVTAHDGAGGLQVTTDGDTSLIAGSNLLLNAVNGDIHTILPGDKNLWIWGNGSYDRATSDLVAAATTVSAIAVGTVASGNGGMSLLVAQNQTVGSPVTPTTVFQVDGNGVIQSHSLASGATQVLKADPNGNLILGGSEGGGPSFVDNVVVVGSGTVWSLPNAPNPPASLQLYQQLTGFGQVLLSAGTDYTLSGTSIITTNSLAAGALRAWFRF